MCLDGTDRLQRARYVDEQAAWVTFKLRASFAVDPGTHPGRKKNHASAPSLWVEEGIEKGSRIRKTRKLASW